MPQKQAASGTQNFPFRICNDIAGITEHDVGERNADGFHRAATTNDNLQ